MSEYSRRSLVPLREDFSYITQVTRSWLKRVARFVNRWEGVYGDDVLIWEGGGGSGDPDPHAGTHQAGGSDVIDVTGLSGVLADRQDADKIQGRNVHSAAPDDGMVLKWVATSNRYEPAALDAGGELEAHASTHKSGGSDSIKLDEWAAPDDNTNLNASTAAHGLLPKLSGSSDQVLHGNGTWASKTYVHNHDGVYLLLENVPWGSGNPWVLITELFYGSGGVIYIPGNGGSTVGATLLGWETTPELGCHWVCVQNSAGNAITWEQGTLPPGGSLTGDILYWSDTTKKWAVLPAGTTGKYLRMGSAKPEWVDAPIADGQVIGDVLYWNGSSWVRLAPGTAGQVLRSNGSGSAPSWGAGVPNGGSTRQALVKNSNANGDVKWDWIRTV